MKKTSGANGQLRTGQFQSHFEPMFTMGFLAGPGPLWVYTCQRHLGLKPLWDSLWWVCTCSHTNTKG